MDYPLHMLPSTCTVDRKRRLTFKRPWATWLNLIALSLLFVSARPKPDAAPLRVLIFLETECPICQKTTGRTQQLADTYAGQVRFEAVFPAETVTQAEAQAFATAYSLRLPYQLDPRHKLVKRYRVTTTPEVVLLSADGKVLYQGSVDDQFYRLGRARPAPTAFYLRDAIDATLTNQPVAIPRTTPVGCLIN
ncbi:AhpC/TSA family protein [Spirosoma oryzae]|uniref:AhpC/TSA family protein n=2 Tax=Spirosoma oryzae TaxID=1469603 RepID=A0A2T0SW09_9BACT|nr:AhpC/TSA family protein [Spirosoma oryzae]